MRKVDSAGNVPRYAERWTKIVQSFDMRQINEQDRESEVSPSARRVLASRAETCFECGAPFPHAVAEAIIVRRMSAEKSPAHTVEILRIELKWPRSALLVLLVTELAFDARCWAISV